MLEQINKPNDIKNIPENRLVDLASEIRTFLVKSVSRTGGHLASNLGTVELTIALHRVYDLPKDKIVWDVGHQAYTHKILTGRKNDFAKLRKFDGISGFPRREESDCDCFDVGHSSTSISAGVGYVNARELTGEDYQVVSVIGDGSLTGGMAYEAMNNAANLKTNFVIILNDNEMSISKNVGGMSNYLSDLRTSSGYTGLKMGITSGLEKIPVLGGRIVNTLRRTKNSLKQLVIPGMFFENMGITYLGPVDGHDISKLTKVLSEAKRFEGPILVHVLTQKGRGYEPAAERPDEFHGVSAFDMVTGESLNSGGPGYSSILSGALLKLAEKDPDIVAVTAAMAEGTGLHKFARRYPNRFFDVGIAEGHAVTFTAALALGGLKPIFAVYSSFLQRGFDQLLHDICMQNVHAVIAVDRAGLVGADGKTHQGAFDLSYLNMMPGMTILAPKNDWELPKMLRFAMEWTGPIAIRYPRGSAETRFHEYRKPIRYGKAEVMVRGKGIALLAVGVMVATAWEIHEKLIKEGISSTVVNMRFVKPFDKDLLRELATDHSLFVTMEENILSGGFGEQVMQFVEEEQLGPVLYAAAIRDRFVGHGDTAWQRKMQGLDAESIISEIRRRLRKDEHVQNDSE